MMDQENYEHATSFEGKNQEEIQKNSSRNKNHQEIQTNYKEIQKLSQICMYIYKKNQVYLSYIYQVYIKKWKKFKIIRNKSPKKSGRNLKTFSF